MKRLDRYLDRIPLLNPPPLAGEEIGGGMKGDHMRALRWGWRVAIVVPFNLPQANQKITPAPTRRSEIAAVIAYRIAYP
jgi:hypothetical protein